MARSAEAKRNTRRVLDEVADSLTFTSSVCFADSFPSRGSLNKNPFLSICWVLSDNSDTPIPHNNQVARPEDARERANKSQLSSEVYSFDIAIALFFPLRDTHSFSITQKCERPRQRSGVFSSHCRIPRMKAPSFGLRAMILSYAPKIVVRVMNLMGSPLNN